MWAAIITLILGGCSALPTIEKPVKDAVKDTISIDQSVSTIERLLLWTGVAVILGTIYFIIGERNA